MGKIVHRGLEIYYRHRQQNVRLPAAEIAELLIAQWEEAVASEGVEFSTPSEEVAARKQSLDLVRVALEQLPANEPRPMSVETVLEAPLVDPVSGQSLGIPLVGVIDLVLPGTMARLLPTSRRRPGEASSWKSPTKSS